MPKLAKSFDKQIVLLNDANISTIHSFCLEVIKNYFYEIGISPNFRIGDNAEIKLLKQETLEEVFEELYEEENKDFIKLVDTYCGYRNELQSSTPRHSPDRKVLLSHQNTANVHDYYSARV